MQTIEQTAIINAPLATVMAAVKNIEGIPGWATVKGTVRLEPNSPDHFHWRFEVGRLKFAGQLRIIEQTGNRLITRTTGDVDSMWTIDVTAIGLSSTAIRVVVEYTLPHSLVEPLVDQVVQQLASPQAAQENMRRFKATVEGRIKTLAERATLAVTKPGNV
ncbi:MAG: SRPBCC family protein [Chloroflexota bacterium]